LLTVVVLGRGRAREEDAASAYWCNRRTHAESSVSRFRPYRSGEHDEELAAVGALPAVSHAEQAPLRVPVNEWFVVEMPTAVRVGRATVIEPVR